MTNYLWNYIFLSEKILYVTASCASGSKLQFIVPLKTGAESARNMYSGLAITPRY
jgi:hypothetical protein